MSNHQPRLRQCQYFLYLHKHKLQFFRGKRELFIHISSIHVAPYVLLQPDKVYVLSWQTVRSAAKEMGYYDVFFPKQRQNRCCMRKYSFKMSSIVFNKYFSKAKGKTLKMSDEMLRHILCKIINFFREKKLQFFWYINLEVYFLRATVLQLALKQMHNTKLVIRKYQVHVIVHFSD